MEDAADWEIFGVTTLTASRSRGRDENQSIQSKGCYVRIQMSKREFRREAELANFMSALETLYAVFSRKEEKSGVFLSNK